MEATELRMHIRNTQSFINERPSQIILIPQTEVRKPGGATATVIGSPRPTQTFRIIETSMVGDDQHLQQSEGKVRRQPSWLLGMPDAEIAIDDTWLNINGRRWRVAEVMPPNGYETRAVVEEVGK
jgi:hypothetical protein